MDFSLKIRNAQHQNAPQLQTYTLPPGVIVNRLWHLRRRRLNHSYAAVASAFPSGIGFPLLASVFLPASMYILILWRRCFPPDVGGISGDNVWCENISRRLAILSSHRLPAVVVFRLLHLPAALARHPSQCFIYVDYCGRPLFSSFCLSTGIVSRQQMNRRDRVHSISPCILTCEYCWGYLSRTQRRGLARRKTTRMTPRYGVCILGK